MAPSEALQWVHAKQIFHSFQLSATACTAAAQGGHIDILRWLRQHAYPWVAEHEDAGEQQRQDTRISFTISGQNEAFSSDYSTRMYCNVRSPAVTWIRYSGYTTSIPIAICGHRPIFIRASMLFTLETWTYCGGCARESHRVHGTNMCGIQRP